MQYLLLYLAVGFPFAIVAGLAHRREDDLPPEYRVLFGLFMLPAWPFFVIAVVRELLMLRRLRVVCGWCHEYVTTLDKEPEFSRRWAEHVLECQKHPARARIAELESDLARLEEVMAENVRIKASLEAAMAFVPNAWGPEDDIYDQEDGTFIQDTPETFIETVNMEGQPVRVPFDILKRIARDVEIAAPIVRKDAEARKVQEEDGET
jgi:hypothetical protein